MQSIAETVLRPSSFLHYRLPSGQRFMGWPESDELGYNAKRFWVYVCSNARVRSGDRRARVVSRPFLKLSFITTWFLSILVMSSAFYPFNGQPIHIRDSIFIVCICMFLNALCTVSKIEFNYETMMCRIGGTTLGVFWRWSAWVPLDECHVVLLRGPRSNRGRWIRCGNIYTIAGFAAGNRVWLYGSSLGRSVPPDPSWLPPGLPRFRVNSRFAGLR